MVVASTPAFVSKFWIITGAIPAVAIVFASSDVAEHRPDGLVRALHVTQMARVLDDHRRQAPRGRRQTVDAVSQPLVHVEDPRAERPRLGCTEQMPVVL